MGGEKRRGEKGEWKGAEEGEGSREEKRRGDEMRGEKRRGECKTSVDAKKTEKTPSFNASC